VIEMFSKRMLTGLLIFFFMFLIFGAEKVRDYLTTGGWYPASGTELNALLTGLFKKADSRNISEKISGLVVPHAGFSYSGTCAARAYRHLVKQRNRIQRIILLGSSHHSGYYGACVSDFTHHSTPLGKIALDRGIIDKLARESGFRTDNRVMQHEHSLENQLPFLQRIFQGRDIRIVPILFGRLDKVDYPRMANIIARHVDENTLVVASSDLNHYGRNFGYTPFTSDIKENLTRLDRGMIEKITRLDIEGYFQYRQKTGITMCGFVPVGVLIHLFPPDRYSARLVDYSKSGDRNQDYSLSVSYASVIIQEKNAGGSRPVEKKMLASLLELIDREQQTLLSLARETLAHYLKTGNPEGIHDRRYAITHRLRKTAGVFVTLKKNNRLRGCIGTLIGRKPLYQGVIDNVINAAAKDPRFSPVKKEELEGIEIEISVMTPLQQIDDYKKIRLGVDGVIIKNGHYQAVFLPQVAAETGWNLDEFLANLCRKAGLDVAAYRSVGMIFYVFQAQVFGESKHR
jgi:AmmeMemoRadiSam system protein B/AmmeMemoRadiSam system protein A